MSDRRNYLMQLPAMTWSASRVASIPTLGNLDSREVASPLCGDDHQPGAERISRSVIQSSVPSPTKR